MRPLLVGESNPYGADPRFALYPEPAGCAGARLCHVILDMTADEYLAAFDRVNLLDCPRWSLPASREAAQRLLDRGQDLVLLGARVAHAFDPAWGAFSEYRAAGLRVLVLPHPSGRCRAWNEPGAVERARAAVRAFL